MCYVVLFLFPTVVDADVLLEKELVTLDEALKTANTAVLMAINGLSILTSVSLLVVFLCDSQTFILSVNFYSPCSLVLTVGSFTG